jgi:hypothetical protein
MSDIPHKFLEELQNAMWSAEENTQLLIEDHLVKLGRQSTTKNDSWLSGYHRDLAEFKRLGEKLLEYWHE